MPGDLLETSRKELGITKEEVLRSVNQGPMPSRYLAGFSKFIYERIDHKYMHDLVYSSFKAFIEEYLIRYEGFKGYNTGFMGSIAIQYKKVLKEVLDAYQIVLYKVESNPIDGLVEYHLSKHF
jgi:hypothetical protein